MLIALMNIELERGELCFQCYFILSFGRCRPRQPLPQPLPQWRRDPCTRRGASRWLSVELMTSLSSVSIRVYSYLKPYPFPYSLEYERLGRDCESW